MAVYKKTYRPYQGPMTPAWTRFLVIARHSLAEIPHARAFRFILIIGGLIPLIYALIIYLHYNIGALQLLKINVASLVPIDASFFMSLIGFQSMLAFFMAALAGPGLISPDLANCALPLYLSRPLSRSGYILGKLTVLLGLLSPLTWIPGLMLFSLQSYLVGFHWMWDNIRIAAGLFLGSVMWILLLSLMALALSAWVKWRPAAGGLMFGLLFVAGGFGQAANQLLRTRWGNLINISHLMGGVWVSLFQEPARRGGGAAFFRIHDQTIPFWADWTALFVIYLFLLFMLSRKIRGVEVVQ